MANPASLLVTKRAGKKVQSYFPIPNIGLYCAGMKDIPALHVVADSIPLAHHRATRAVLKQGMQIRTQYDRKNSAGEFIDPPSYDASALIHITDPFNQPRYPMISFCERGKYIAEIMGAKDHLVVPVERLSRELQSGHLSATE